MVCDRRDCIPIDSNRSISNLLLLFELRDCPWSISSPVIFSPGVRPDVPNWHIPSGAFGWNVHAQISEMRRCDQPRQKLLLSNWSCHTLSDGTCYSWQSSGWFQYHINRVSGVRSLLMKPGRNVSLTCLDNWSCFQPRSRRILKPWILPCYSGTPAPLICQMTVHSWWGFYRYAQSWIPPAVPNTRLRGTPNWWCLNLPVWCYWEWVDIC